MTVLEVSTTKGSADFFFYAAAVSYRIKKGTPECPLLYVQIINYALSTAPERKHLVQTCILLAAPFTLHFTLFTFEFQIALDLL